MILLGCLPAYDIVPVPIIQDYPYPILSIVPKGSRYEAFGASGVSMVFSRTSGTKPTQRPSLAQQEIFVDPDGNALGTWPVQWLRKPGSSRFKKLQTPIDFLVSGPYLLRRRGLDLCTINGRRLARSPVGVPHAFSLDENRRLIAIAGNKGIATKVHGKWVKHSERHFKGLICANDRYVAWWREGWGAEVEVLDLLRGSIRHLTYRRETWELGIDSLYIAPSGNGIIAKTDLAVHYWVGSESRRVTYGETTLFTSCPAGRKGVIIGERSGQVWLLPWPKTAIPGRG